MNQPQELVISYRYDRSSRRAKYVKSTNSRWEPLQNFNYKALFGDIPRNMVVWSHIPLDEINPYDCTHLELISRAENYKRLHDLFPLADDEVRKEREHLLKAKLPGVFSAHGMKDRCKSFIKRGSPALSELERIYNTTHDHEQKETTRKALEADQQKQEKESRASRRKKAKEIIKTERLKKYVCFDRIDKYIDGQQHNRLDKILALAREKKIREYINEISLPYGRCSTHIQDYKYGRIDWNQTLIDIKNQVSARDGRAKEIRNALKKEKLKPDGSTRYIDQYIQFGKHSVTDIVARCRRSLKNKNRSSQRRNDSDLGVRFVFDPTSPLTKERQAMIWSKTTFGKITQLRRGAQYGDKGTFHDAPKLRMSMIKQSTNHE